MGVITVSDMKDVLVTVIASGAFFTFLQFLINRYDTKKSLEAKISALQDTIEEHKAILARTHILRFADELRNGVHHSEDYFRQQILDCDTYEHYCNNHPDFSNGLTVIASEYIKEEFEKLYKKEK